MTTLHIWRRRARALVLVLLGLTIASAFGLVAYYLWTAPRVPLAATGQIYATNVNHGAIVYLTHCQRFLLHDLFFDVFFGLLALAGLLSLPDVRADETGKRKS